MSKFDNSDIVFWSLDFDNDGYHYIHHNLEAVLNAIRDFIDNEIDEDNDEKKLAVDKILENCVGVLDGSSNSSSIVLIISDKSICARRLALDKFTAIHRILSEVYPVVNDNLKKKIDAVFQHSS